jgi:hypothetical protein
MKFAGFTFVDQLSGKLCNYSRYQQNNLLVGIEHNSSSVRYVDLFQQTEEILIVLPRNLDSDWYNLKRKRL